MAPLIRPKQYCSGGSLYFSLTLYCFSLKVLHLSKTLGKARVNVMLHGDPWVCLQSLQSLRTFYVWQVYRGLMTWTWVFAVVVIIVIICVENVDGFHGPQIIHWRSAVEAVKAGGLPYLNQHRMGTWLFRKSFLAFQRCLGPSVLCKDQPCESNPSTFRRVSTPRSQGSYHFTDFTGLFTSQNTLCQRGESYKTPNSFKCVWCH